MGSIKYLKRILRKYDSNTVYYDIIVLNLNSDVIFSGSFMCDKYDGTFKDIVLNLGSGRAGIALKYNARPAELLHCKCRYNKVNEYYDLLCTFDGYTELSDEEMDVFKPYFKTVCEFYATHGYM